MDMLILSQILEERARQHEIGWTPESDDQWTERQLMLAAHYYATEGRTFWPFPTTPRQVSKDYRTNLIKAGALIMAEIERLDRITEQSFKKVPLSNTLQTVS